MAEKNSETPENGIGASGPTQFWAGVWLVSILVIGVLAVTNLAKIDAFMYQTGGDVLNYDEYRENRSSQASIPSDVLDKRLQNMSLTQVEKTLTK